MTAIRSVPFRARHVGLIRRLRTGLGDFVGEDQRDAAAAAYETSGAGFSMICDYSVLACGGVSIVGPGVGAAWSFLSDDVVADHPVALLRWARRSLDQAVRTLGIWRVQTVADPENPGSLRWIRWLGFEHEGNLRRFGPRGEDLPLFSRIWPEHLPREPGGNDGQDSRPAPVQTSAVGTGISALVASEAP